jgi:ATP-binding cassette, subfamily B, bacterial
MQHRLDRRHRPDRTASPGGRTVIMIAHRLSSVRNFDRIVVLEAGQIVQDGPPEQLMRQDGVYRALIEREMRLLTRQVA